MQLSRQTKPVQWLSGIPFCEWDKLLAFKALYKPIPVELSSVHSFFPRPA